jgi:DHA1 family bicyclomycin/chloramphenicol resistance-like MFS transporter
VGAAALMAVVAWLSDGRPPFALFGVTIALLLPAVAMLMPNCNTAAMVPLPHVAGTAAALLGTVSTAGGSLLGSVIDGRFDGTIGPFAAGVLLYAVIAALGVIVLGLRPVTGAVRAVPGVPPAPAEPAEPAGALAPGSPSCSQG